MLLLSSLNFYSNLLVRNFESNIGNLSLSLFTIQKSINIISTYLVTLQVVLMPQLP